MTGRIKSNYGLPLELEALSEMSDRVLVLDCAVRYIELNVPMQGPRGVITHTITAVRPDLDADDNPTCIPTSNISRFKKADPNKSAEEFVRLRHTADIQTCLREKMEKEMRDAERRASSTLALPGGGGDPRGIPPHILAAMQRKGVIG